ncbi:hypothetical protein ACFLU3_01935 [Chloroflexota bacterium]
MALCPECDSELNENVDVCPECGAANIDGYAGTSVYEKAIEDLTDQLIAGAFAMTSTRGQEEMSSIVNDIAIVNWNTIAIETMLFFHHIIDRYLEGLFEQEMRAKIIDSMELRLIGKFAKAGSVSDENIGDFHKMYIHKLEQRSTEYRNYELGEVIDEEITLGVEGFVLGNKVRTEKFAAIFLSEDDISEVSSEDIEGIEVPLLWQFGKRIAELLGEPQSTKALVYVYRYTVAFLFLTLNPVKELNNIRSILRANDTD